jgi:5'-deoxynucleotidase YfbR-like HD superfamily hydrolase
MHEHALEAWRYLNPRSDMFTQETQANVFRYQNHENGFFEEYETNWEHTLRMTQAYANLCQYFPEIMNEFEHETVLKIILWHDTPEFLYGDMPISQQTESKKLLKTEREAEAIAEIITASSLDMEVGKIFEEYERRELKEAVLVKVIDVIAGYSSFADLLCRFIPATSDEITLRTGMSGLEYTNYLFNVQFEKVSQIFLEWETKLMRFFRLGEYAPEMGDDWHQQNKTSVNRALLLADDDNPASLFFYALEYEQFRHRDLIYGIQFDLDRPDFRQRLEASMKRADFGRLGDFDLFGDPVETASPWH